MTALSQAANFREPEKSASKEMHSCTSSPANHSEGKVEYAALPAVELLAVQHTQLCSTTQYSVALLASSIRMTNTVLLSDV
jgi:hypothetical protein